MANPTAAEALYDRLESRVQLLVRFPEAGARRPKIDRAARVLVEQPYLILYRVTAQGVQIVRVVHGARRLGRALFAAGIE